MNSTNEDLIEQEGELIMEINDRQIEFVVCGVPGCSDTYSVGTDGVYSIDYHVPAGPGDQHFIDVKYKSGSMARVFNVMYVKFGDSKKPKLNRKKY